jgi:hypothetical protein
MLVSGVESFAVSAAVSLMSAVGGPRPWLSVLMTFLTQGTGANSTKYTVDFT